MDRYHDVLKVAKQLYIDSDYDTLLFINKDTGEALYTASAQEIKEIVDQIRKESKWLS